jgi:hypothetical protein
MLNMHIFWTELVGYIGNTHAGILICTHRRDWAIMTLQANDLAVPQNIISFSIPRVLIAFPFGRCIMKCDRFVKSAIK